MGSSHLLSMNVSIKNTTFSLFVRTKSAIARTAVGLPSPRLFQDMQLIGLGGLALQVPPSTCFLAQLGRAP